MYNECLGPSPKSTSNEISSWLVESYIRTKLVRFFKIEILKIIQSHAGSFTLVYINHLTLLINIKARQQENVSKRRILSDFNIHDWNLYNTFLFHMHLFSTFTIKFINAKIHKFKLFFKYWQITSYWYSINQKYISLNCSIYSK